MARLTTRVTDRVARLAGIDRLGRRAQRRRLLIVCYHGLRDDADPTRHWLLLPRSAFEAQIAYLAAHYECLPIDIALERLWSGELRVPTACVTFDDGYRSNLTIGLPILQRHAVPATVYLATALIGTSRLLWTTSLELAFRRSRVPVVDLAAIGLGEQPLDGPDTRARIGKTALEALKLRSRDERDAIVSDLEARLAADGTEPRADFRPDAFGLLGWNEVRSLSASGLVTFGGHTVHHEIVSRLDDDALDAEIGGSVAAVRGAVPEALSLTFAYPNGRPQDIDKRAEAALRRAGCTAAVTTTEGLNDPGTPHMHLRRAVIGGDATFDRFLAQATGLRALLTR